MSDVLGKKIEEAVVRGEPEAVSKEQEEAAGATPIHGCPG